MLLNSSGETTGYATAAIGGNMNGFFMLYKVTCVLVAPPSLSPLHSQSAALYKHAEI